MKKTHIIGIVLVAVAIASMFALLGNSSTYADFKTAADSDDLTKKAMEIFGDDEF